MVDLRRMSDEELDPEWPLERIEALTKMLSSIGNDVRETWQLVEEGATANEVRIRKESALRYEVPAEVWEHGLPMRRWAEGSRVLLSEVNPLTAALLLPKSVGSRLAGDSSPAAGHLRTVTN